MIQQLSYLVTTLHTLTNGSLPRRVLNQSLVGDDQRLGQLYVRVVRRILSFNILLVDQLFVFLQSSGGDEGLVTLIARDGVLVLFEVGLVGRVAVEYFTTFTAGRFLPGTQVLVDLHVSYQRALHCEGSITLATLERFVLGVNPQVSDQVTRLLELSEQRRNMKNQLRFSDDKLCLRQH